MSSVLDPDTVADTIRPDWGLAWDPDTVADHEAVRCGDHLVHGPTGLGLWSSSWQCPEQTGNTFEGHSKGSKEHTSCQG